MEARGLTSCFYNKMSAAVHFMEKKKKFLLTQKLRNRKKSKRLSQSSAPREPLVVLLNEKRETEARKYRGETGGVTKITLCSQGNQSSPATEFIKRKY